MDIFFLIQVVQYSIWALVQNNTSMKQRIGPLVHLHKRKENYQPLKFIQRKVAVQNLQFS